MKQLWFSAALWLLLSIASAGASGSSATSALRFSGQSYLEAAATQLPDTPLSENGSAWSLQQKIAELDLTKIPAADSLDVLNRMFDRVRDHRQWIWDEMPSFPRRIPWLYIEDGCFVRAGMMVEKFREWKDPLPKQVLIFGDLQGVSNHQTVYWWFHVAPILRVGQQAFVLDPSVEAQRPLELKEWVARLSPHSEDVSAAICETDVIEPEQDCMAKSPPWSAEDFSGQIQNFLDQEWNSIETNLGTTPESVLGDHPPWKKP